MAAQTANLYLLEDLDDVNKTKSLAKSDLDALRKVADWIKSFVTKPHKEIGGLCCHTSLFWCDA